MRRIPEEDNPGMVDSSTSPTRWEHTHWIADDAHLHYDVAACDVDFDLQQHIQHCTCTCNHLGYGNFMDYQTACLSEIQDGGRSMSRSPRCRVSENTVTQCNGHLRSVIEPLNCASGNQRGYRRYDIQLKPCVIGIAVVIVVIIVCLIINSCLPNVPPHLRTFEQRLEIVRELLMEVPLIDGHNDLPWNYKTFARNKVKNVNFNDDLRTVEPWSKSIWSHTDLPRLRKGMVGAQFWSAYVPCRASSYHAIIKQTIEQIDSIRVFINYYPNHLQFADSAEGIRKAHSSGQIASLIGLEGGHTIDHSLEVLRSYYNSGVRYLTLTHSCSTLWASCCYGSGAVHNADKGISLFGHVVIKELNRLGMIIDLSHTSVRTMEDTLNITLAPVIFSHSCVFALCNNTRNVPDHILKLLALNGGLVMVSFYSYYLTCNESSTMDDVIAHINYVRDIAGEDYVGIGAGYDGINYTAAGLEDVSRYPRLFATLMKDPSWGETQIKKLAGLNFLRVFERVEQVRDEMMKVQPMTEHVEDFGEIPAKPPKCESSNDESTTNNKPI